MATCAKSWHTPRRLRSTCETGVEISVACCRTRSRCTCAASDHCRLEHGPVRREGWPRVVQRLAHAVRMARGTHELQAHPRRANRRCAPPCPPPAPTASTAPGSAGRSPHLQPWLRAWMTNSSCSSLMVRMAALLPKSVLERDLRRRRRLDQQAVPVDELALCGPRRVRCTRCCDCSTGFRYV